VIMMHDFWQILSVSLQGRHTDIVSAAVTSSEIYDQFTQLHLRRNIRVQRFLQTNAPVEKSQRLQEYSDWLLDLGDEKNPSAVPVFQELLTDSRSNDLQIFARVGGQGIQ
jgi:hypothetical protein